MVLNQVSQLSVSRNFVNDVRMSFLEGAESTAGVQKRKLSFNGDNEPCSKSSRNSYGKSVPVNVHAMLERKADLLEAQVIEYQRTWMRE